LPTTRNATEAPRVATGEPEPDDPAEDPHPLAAELVIKELCYTALASEPMAWCLRRVLLAGKSVVLMYHEIAEDDRDIEAWAVVRKSDFVEQMEYLRKHFDVVSLQEALARRESRHSPSRPIAVVTFDDGDRGNAEVLLPIVSDLELPVSIFVATRQVVEQRNYWFDRVVNTLQTAEAVTVDLTQHGLGHFEVNRVRGAANWGVIQGLLERLKGLPSSVRERVVEELVETLNGKAMRPGRIAPLDRDGVRALAASPFVSIGAHSHCHNILTQLDPDAVEKSVATSKQLLESWTGKEVWSFAYPNGDYDERVAGIVRNLGFRCAITTGNRLWAASDSQYAIPRMGIGRYDSPEQFKLSLVGGLRNTLTALPWTARAASHTKARPGETQESRV